MESVKKGSVMSAVLIKICRWKRFFVGKEWAMRCVSLVMLEGKKGI